ncbi:DNA phosphorothioation-dependent restriction protein DptG [Metabacillus idriensis]|uniref:DNA phosphorothioation-dependent restriction protein DptG n=1 Tax=Metabacillus idriensis TaxID=324768 RepID=UPI002812A0BF|nr:DNA phosphorothioation-dependent restriction protein DptG [Metabacillus idriensis]MDR0136692.1 DNA phosphorothioation-dependent restriction protein DptG [Metabacillus idriensis]
MSYTLDFDKVKNFVTDKNDKYSFERKKYVRILPLPSRTGDRAAYKDGFSMVTAALLRLVDNEPLEFTTGDNFLNTILDAGDYDSDETKAMFEEFLTFELGNVDTDNAGSFQNLKYISLPEEKAEYKGQMQVIHFFYDIYIREQHDEIQDVLSELQHEGLMHEIMNIEITKTLSSLKPQFRVLFKQYQETFLEDLKALAKNPGFLVEYIDDLFLHYTFIAMTQIIFQTNKFSSFDELKLHSFPFLMNQEKASKWRLGYKEGFSRVKDQIMNFYTHEHLLNILALNTFTTDENLYYHDYKKILSEAGEDVEKQYIESLYKWINEVFTHYHGLEEIEEYNGQDIDTAYRYMFEKIRREISSEIFSRYALAYTNFISKFYRKNGGSLGTILALNLKQLLLLTAVAVGSKPRIELNQLWVEFDKRGVIVDDDTKLEIVELLDKLNYLDKKSDSGDAQYVKSIL